MTLKLDLKKATIIPGDKDCQHFEIIKRVGTDLMGKCEKCGRVINYTILQSQLPEMTDGYTEHLFNMNQLIKGMKGNTKALKERRETKRRMVNS